MKQLFLMLLSILILAGCDDTKTPKDTVREYLQAIDNFEFEKANALLLANPENKIAMDNMKRYATTLSEAKKKELFSKAKGRIYNILEKESSENEALVIATNNEGAYTVAIAFELVKDKEKWLIKKINDAG
jgi:hypothetical protein